MTVWVVMYRSPEEEEGEWIIGVYGNEALAKAVAEDTGFSDVCQHEVIE